MTIIRVPASTANLGPGFDALGMALSIEAHVGIVDDGGTAETGRVVDEHHPAAVAFAAAGGKGRLWVRAPIPVGRGLGFSGAMRVGGAAAAVAARAPGDRAALAESRAEVLTVAVRLEGHADNAAASVYGGIVATDGARAVPLPTPLAPDVVVWIPPTATATSTSRSTLPRQVAFGDAVFNVGRVAMLIAAVVTGDVAALRDATADRLHQDLRFAAAPESRQALDAGLLAGAWCGWLSGSGPAVALLTARGAGAELAGRLPPGGRSRVLGIDFHGVGLVR